MTYIVKPSPPPPTFQSVWCVSLKAREQLGLKFLIELAIFQKNKKDGIQLLYLWISRKR